MIKYYKVTSTHCTRYYATYNGMQLTKFAYIDFGADLVDYQEVDRDYIPHSASIHSAGLTLADTRQACRFAQED